MVQEEKKILGQGVEKEPKLLEDLEKQEGINWREGNKARIWLPKILFFTQKILVDAISFKRIPHR